MEQEAEQYRDTCLALCNKLLISIEENREAAGRFCNEEIYKTYVSVNEQVAGQVRQIKRKIQSL